MKEGGISTRERIHVLRASKGLSPWDQIQPSSSCGVLSLHFCLRSSELDFCHSALQESGLIQRLCFNNWNSNSGFFRVNFVSSIALGLSLFFSIYSHPMVSLSPFYLWRSWNFKRWNDFLKVTQLERKARFWIHFYMAPKSSLLLRPRLCFTSKWFSSLAHFGTSGWLLEPVFSSPLSRPRVSTSRADAFQRGTQWCSWSVVLPELVELLWPCSQTHKVSTFRGRAQVPTCF